MGRAAVLVRGRGRPGGASRWAGPSVVDPADPCATSATTRPTPSPAGPGRRLPDRGRVGGSPRAGHPRTSTSSTCDPPPGAARARGPLRLGLAVDLERLRPYPGFRAAPGRGRRVQRQVHGEPARAARRERASRRRAHPGHLPQLLPRLGPVALHRASARPRRLRPHADRTTPSMDVHLSAADLRARSRTTSGPGSPPSTSGSRRCGSTTTWAASCSTRSPGSPSTTRPGPSAAARGARGRDRRRDGGRHLGRARRRHVREVTDPARRLGGDGHAASLRAPRRR